jgi:hypothetical protein
VQDGIEYLSGEIILERQVSVRLARTPVGTPVAGSAFDDEEPVRKRNKRRGRGRGKGKAQSPAHLEVREELQEATIGGTPGDQTLLQITIKHEEDTESLTPQRMDLLALDSQNYGSRNTPALQVVRSRGLNV